jgi:glycosyltransferase involved in cell wall biosynthesis
MQKPKNFISLLSLQYYCYPDEVGGAWGLTYQINKRLTERGHKVYQITCKSSETQISNEIVDGIQYFRISLKASKNIFLLWKALRKQIKNILRSEPINLIHIHNPLIGFIALLLPNLWKIPKVYHFHSSWFDEERINSLSKNNFSFVLNLKLQLIRIIEWTCYKFSVTILFLSEYSKKRFKEYFNFSKANLVIIPGGVDLKEFQPLQPEENLYEIRSLLSLKKKPPVILTVRRLEERMGLENLILAVEMLIKKFSEKEFQLIIVGKGSLRQKLEAMIIEKNLSGVIKLSGLVSREKLPLYFKVADLFVLPTTAIEGFGLVTAEAFASGLAVMGTPVGATMEILEKIDKNLIFDGTSPESLSNGLEYFFHNPKFFSKLESKCRKTAEKYYSWEKVTDQTEEEFIKIIKLSNLKSMG